MMQNIMIVCLAAIFWAALNKAAVKMKNVFCCLVVLAILLSAMPVSGFAVGSSNNSASNTLDHSDEPIISFLIDNTPVMIASGDEPKEIKFKGTLKEKNCIIGFSAYYFNVDEVLEGSIPEDDEIRVMVYCSASPPLDNYDVLEAGDKAEIYAIQIGDSKVYDVWVEREVWGASITSSAEYYVKKLGSEPSLSISVWTDKPEYEIGDIITIYYQTNKECTAKLTITKPDGSGVVYGPNEIPVCTRSKLGTAGYPTGTRTVTFEAWVGDEYKIATCYFDVVEEKKPDLIVSSINFNPNPANKYDDVTVSITVKNQGNGDAGPHHEFLGYPDRYTILKEWYCSRLEAGASKTFTHTLENVQHSDTYEVCADWGQAVQESDDNNNCLTAHLEVKESEEKPNLIIESILPDIPNPKEGETITFTVKTKNIGSGDAEESFYIYYYIDGDKKGSYYVSGGLDADKTKTTYFSWKADKCGNVEMKAWADATDRVDEESDEGDNIKIRTLDVECPEDTVEKYALIIGISEYDHIWPPLKYTINEANAIHVLLIYGYGYKPNNVIKLIDREATQMNIMKKLMEFNGKVDSNDIFIFYFGGHGYRDESNGEEYICPVDSTPGNSGNDLSSTTLKGLLSADGTLIAIFSSCFSGGMALDTDIDTPIGSQNGINRDNAVVLMSSGVKEISLSVFTPYLFKAFTSDRIKSNIAPRDKQVSIEEAFIYAKPKVERHSAGILQHPVMMDHYLAESANRAPCHLSEHPINPDFIAGMADCPVHLHAYDSKGRHTGLNAAGDGIEDEIPGSFYNGPEYDPEEITVLGESDNIMYKVEALDSGVFNFTIKQGTETETTIITYLDVPVTETTVATIDVSQANPTYTMKIDTNGDGTPEAITEPDSIDIIGETTYPIQLHTGWNLISLPITPDDSDVFNVLNSVDGNWNSVWSYEAGTWKRYDLTGPGFLNDLTTIEPGRGYWINMESDDTLYVSGSEPTVKSIPLVSGWNLVGYNSLSSMSTTDAMNSIDGNWNSIWSYEAGTWKRYDLTGPDFLNDLTTIEPGKGYWINMKSPDTWTLGD